MTPQAETIKIIQAVALAHRIPVREIMSRSRVRSILSARNCAIRKIHLLKPWLSSTQIGEIFGRDHVTILYVLGHLEKKPSR